MHSQTTASSPVRALFFDLDDTLMESYAAHHDSVRLCCARVAEAHAGASPDEVHAAYNRLNIGMEALLEGKDLAKVTHLAFREMLWRETLRASGLEAGLAPELAELYVRERSGRHRLFPEVEGALEQMAGSYTMVLVTNGLSDLQREKIAAAGLERWFPHILVSGEVGSWKPDPGIFRRALELAGVRPGEAVMVGDNLSKDVRGAQAVGIRTAWMRRYEHLQPHPEICPDCTVTCGETLRAVLAGW